MRHPAKTLITAALLTTAALLAAAGCRAAPTARPTSFADPSTDLVAEFYKALLQEAPPTREQEIRIFNNDALRHRLVVGKGDLIDTEPMLQTPAQLQQRRLDDEKVAAAGPVLLTLFRKHRELFLPQNLKPRPGVRQEINLTTRFNFNRSIADMKDPPRPGYGYVLALFVHDRSAPPEQLRVRTIVFPFSEGKIDADGIYLDGFQGKLLEEHFQKELEH